MLLAKPRHGVALLAQCLYGYKCLSPGKRGCPPGAPPCLNRHFCRDSIVALGLPVLEIETIEGEEPACDFVSSEHYITLPGKGFYLVRRKGQTRCVSVAE